MQEKEEIRSLSLVSPVWSRSTNLIATHGEGCYLYDPEGTAYLDFTSGIGVTNLGHCHPNVVEAVRRQAGQLLHGQANIVWHEAMLELVAELLSLTPPSLNRFFFSNSGAEAVEGALKLARMATGRTNIIVFQGGFHGRTIGTMSLTTSKTIYRGHYQPLMAGVFVTPYPYAFRYGWDPEQTSRWCLDELRFLLATQTAPEETVGVIVEPVLGEGGYVVPPRDFLQGVRQICDEFDLLLIVDEIQSGIGRTGHWFAHEHFNVMPDIMTLAKGLASGLPLSAVVASGELMDQWKPGSHGGTFGGNAVACAAANATLQTMKQENVLFNTEARGEELMKGLRDLQQNHPRIGDVRGLGLMVGVEFRNEEGSPDESFTKKVLKGCYDHRLLLLSCGPWNNTIRFIPPLIVSKSQIDDALDIFEMALKSAEAQV